MELKDVAEIVRELGAIGVLLLFIFGLRLEWWVMGGQYRNVMKEKEDLANEVVWWRDLALYGKDAIKIAADVLGRRTKQ